MPFKKGLSSFSIILIITTTVYSFSSMSTSFFMMGMKSLPWLLISSIFYFVPYALIVSEYTSRYSKKSGGIYDWLKESLSPKVAFITAFLWYCSYFIWIISLAMKLFIPCSILIFGTDFTTKTSWMGLSTKLLIPILAALAIISITWLTTRGVKIVLAFLKISGFAMLGLLVISMISLFTIGIKVPEEILPNLANSIEAPSFFSGTGYSFLSQMPFFIFSITAFGGLDTIASLADKMSSKRNQFPKAVIISAGLITCFYLLGIVLWSSSTDLTLLRQTDQNHLGNVMYGLMGSLADRLAQCFQLSAGQGIFLRQFFVRYIAFSLFSSYIGLVFSISYAPLKSLVQGTPKELWPRNFTLTNQSKMPEKALWLQALLIILCIFGISLNHSVVGQLFNQLTYMTNIARAVPYLVVAFSFPFFKKKKLDSENHSFIKSQRASFLLSLSVCMTIFLAIGFQIYQPLMDGDYLQSFSLIIGPMSFALVGSIIYHQFEKRQNNQLYDL